MNYPITLYKLKDLLFERITHIQLLLFYSGLVCHLFYAVAFDFHNVPEFVLIYKNSLWKLSMVFYTLSSLAQITQRFNYVIFSLTVILLTYLHNQVTTSLELVFLLVPICASIYIDKKYLLRVYSICYLTILLALAVLFPNGYVLETVKHSFGMIGHSFGLANPNKLGVIISMLVVLIMIEYKITKKRLLFSISFISAILVFYVTLSKTAALLLSIYPILYLIVDKYKRRFSPLLFSSLPLVGIVVSVIISIILGPSEGSTTFASRFAIPYLMYNEFGLSVVSSTSYPLPIDNLYYFFFMHFGILLGVLLFLLTCFFFYKTKKTENTSYIVLALCLFFTGFMEQFPIVLYHNFLPFLVFSKKKLITEE